MQALQGRNEITSDCHRGGNMHRGGKRVVGRLAHVDMVVRMHGTFFACADTMSQHLIRKIRDHFIGVRVGRSAGTSLVDVDGEVRVVPTGGHLFAGSDDGLGELFIELAEFPVRAGRRRP